jgi:hypothetical protein
MPRSLGWILVAGGLGYVLSAYTSHLLPDADALADALTVPASVGEVWMIAYLLIIGVRTATKRTMSEGREEWTRTDGSP